MTYIVHASKGEAVSVTIRLRVIAAVAKAKSLADDGWSVVIIGPNDVQYRPPDFKQLLASSQS